MASGLCRSGPPERVADEPMKYVTDLVVRCKKPSLILEESLGPLKTAVSDTRVLVTGQ